MKKRIFSVFVSIMLLLCPFVLSACGDRYENMEFRISYAFSEDSSNWLDATNGISVTYGGENDSLQIDESLGYGVIYVRVEIANVRERYIDDIIVTTSGISSGLNFSTATVEQNQVFALRITDNVKSNLRFYETNSQKTTNIGLSVSRSITGIEVDTSIKPAVVIGDNVGLALMQVNNLTYLPANKTDQTGVRYSIDSVGAYNYDGASNQNVYVATSSTAGVNITAGGVLTVSNDFVLTDSRYIVRIKATSLYNEEISAYFDVYIVDRIVNTDQSLYVPDVKYSRTANDVGDNMTLYVGNSNYNTSQITIEYNDFSSFYNSERLTIDDAISYGIAVYVDGRLIDFNETETINGLIVENRDGVIFITAIDAEIRTNTIRFALTLNGVEYFTSTEPRYEKQVTLTKEILPTSIRINGETIANGGTANGIVYSTRSDYAGLELTLSAFPENSSNDYLLIESINGSLNNLNITGNSLEHVGSALRLRSGETIRILFNDNVSTEQRISIRVLASPSNFEGETVNETYVSATYILNKVITADSINVYSGYSNGVLTNPIQNANLLINARETSGFYVQVYYTGTVLDASTITLHSNNDAILFSNRSNTISLNDPNVVLEANSVRDAQGNVYNIYRVEILPVASMENSQINISAGDDNITVGAEFAVSSVYLLDESSITMSLSNNNGMEIIPEDNGLAETNGQNEDIKYFAVVKDGYLEVSVLGRAVGSIVDIAQVISDISLSTNTNYSTGNFSTRAITYNVVSGNVFSLTANIGGRTQVLTLTIHYYTTNSVTGLIEEATKNIQLEFAVYDPIQSISLTADQTNITYINSQFEDASSAQISVASSASSAIPSSGVNFTSGSVEHASQLRLSFNRQLNTYDNISVLINRNGELEELDLSNSQNGYILTDGNEQDILNGNIVVRLNGTPTYNSLTLVVEALRFGESSNVAQTITINFADYEYVEGVVVSGNSIVNEGVDSNYIYMSFIDVADGDYDQETFTARARYNTTEPQDGRLRFGDLTYVLYQVDLDNNGQIIMENGEIKLDLVQTERLDVIFNEDGTVRIRADKLLGGGLFKLVIVPQDAYNDETHTYTEDRGTSLFIMISDGTRKNPYIISSEEELNYINNDLNASYVLGDNIVLSGSFTPIGTTDNNGQILASQFNGTLSGTRQTVGSNNQIVSSVRYSISLTLPSPVLDGDGHAYAGLFTILGADAEISNLDLITSYASEYSHTNNGTNLYVGALAGVNSGTISGVSLVTNGTTTITSTTATYFGGLVGSNNGVISLDAECVEFDNVVLTTSNSNADGLNVGLVAGLNAGEISGNYVDKDGLNNIVFNVISNLTIYSNANNAVINVGGVAGENYNGIIKNLLIGGSIEVQNNANYSSTGYVGGVVGVNIFEAGENVNVKYIDSCTVIGLDLISSSTGISLAGIVGSSSGYTITNVRFISANTTFTSARTTVGKIEGAGVVAGIVANSSNDTIEYASLQNFVSGEENNGVVSDFYTLSSGIDQVYGLVNGATSTISNSFVQVNIAVNNNTSTIYLTSNATETSTYFLGKVQNYEGATINSNANSDFNIVYTDNAMYSIANNTATEIDLTNGVFDETSVNVLSEVTVDSLLSEVVVTAETFEELKSSLYILNDTVFTKLDETSVFEEGTTYYSLNEDAILSEISEGLIGVDADSNAYLITEAQQFNAMYTYYNINADYISVVDNSIVVNQNFENLYVEENDRYIKASENIGENLLTYLQGAFVTLTFNEEEWINVIKDNTNVYEGDALKSNYAYESAGVIVRNNFIQIQGLNYYFPYLLNEQNVPVMIIRPSEISANINESYVITINSIYVDKEIDTNEITFAHSAIINYHNSTNPLNNARLNTYNLVNTGSAGDENGLIDVSVLPIDASSGLYYEIVSGMSYAYIVNNEQIVFTGVSGGTPIIVRAYSVFDDTVEAYIAFYTYLGITDLNISANNIEEINDANDTADYELTTFIGSNPYLISIEPENIYQGQECSTLFDLDRVDEFVSVEFEQVSNSVVDIQSTLAIDTVRLGIQENAQFDGNRWDENITIKLIFNLTRYFGENVYPQIGGVDQTIEIDSVVLRVIVFKSATAVEINESGFIINTEGNLNFNASLYTGYVLDAEDAPKNRYDIGCSISQGVVSLNNDTDNKDSITLSFDITSGESEANRLMSITEVDHFAELFDYNFAWQVIESGGLVVGYNYTISMSLEDEFNYRYITSEIEFTLTVSAWSNSGVSDSLLITLTPTTLSSARIENYTATDISSNNSYINLITSSSTETSIIAPGGLGGVMLIYLEPAYSNIISATLTSSTLFVPSLNRDVRINFEQLVYNTDTKSYQTILSGAEPVEGGIQLKLVSTIDNSGREAYNGVIYIHTQLDRFSGLSSTISATLTVETGSTANPTVSVTKQLLTRYLPGASLSYDGIEIRDNEYIIQEDTYSNTMDISVYGYQFNSQPNVNLEWYLNDTTKFTYGSGDAYYSLASSNTYTGGKLTEEEFNDKFDYLFILSNGNYVKLSADATYNSETEYYEPVNRGIIYDVSDTTYSDPYYISNYVTARVDGNYADLLPNTDGSYTMQVLFNVQPDTPTSFKITASQSLTTDESVIVTERSESLIFHTVRAVLNELYFANLNNNTMNLVINHSNTIDFAFNTSNDIIDLNDYIYNRLLAGFTTKDELNNDVLNVEAFVNQFQFVNSAGSVVNLTTNEEDASANHPQFSVRVVNNQLVFTGLETFNNTIEFSVHYGYVYNAEDGKYQLTFGAMNTNSLAYSIDASFNLIIVPSTSETNAIPIYSASDMVDEEGNTRLVEGTDYILMNDITLDLVQPIDVAIASFDGNNRVIKINSFAVSSEQTNYGLFARIGTYTRNDQEEKTILKNIIVDYSGFNSDNNGILSLVGLNNVTFGGLVAVNDGGLIYNCDVMNLSNTTKTINLVTDASMQNLTFGGLVGENNGTITNSRVGRMNYTRIEADANTQTERTVSGEALMFVVGDNTSTDTQTANGFVGVTGGFVGNNSGVIASSYMANTSLINLSTANSLARTAGFVGTNSGTINYSYVKAREDTISYNSPSATGAYIRAATNGNVAGFVHVNSGTITNSFANTELITTSAFMAGFVYQNSSAGIISECYAACTLNGSNNSLDVSEQPFVGVDEAGTLLSDGQIENSYFLISDNYSEIVEQDGKAQAIALNTENFIDSDKLTGFVFINSTSQTERNQGVWTYYSGNVSVVLPELTNTNIVAHSYRYLVDVTDNEDYVTYNYTNAINYAEGSANNPYIIRDVDEFNEIMTRNSTETNRSMTGYVRFIDDIDFASNSRAIQTRVNFTLGDENNRAVTSIDGNGMNISGIYLDVLDATSATDIGLFSRVENAYIKNLNLNFVSTTLTDDQFSSVSVQYSGGLAGRINNSAIINISLNGSSTTIAGRNFAGGLAGVITGSSMIYGIDTNLSVKAVNTDYNYYMYYNEADFNTMRAAGILPYGNYSDYLTNLSYAGGVAGVIDIVERSNIDFNLSYVNVLGTEMYDRSQANGNIQADYAGGVAGYMNNQTNALRVKFIVGTNNLILGQRATGGLFAVARGSITASQVSAPEDTQYDYDTAFGKYVTDLRNGSEAVLDGDYGNLNLLEGYGYVGGLVGISIGTTINSSYSKASIRTGEVVGGLIGTSYASSVVYSYAVPYINLDYNADIYESVGGLIGSAYGVRQIGTVISRNNPEYEAIALRLNNIVSQDTDLQFTFSTILLDNDEIIPLDATFDYISADYRDGTQYITSNESETLAYVFAGLVNYTSAGEGSTVLNSMTSIASNINLDELFDIYGTNIQQETIFYEVFSGWSEEYWTLDSTKYYPLLLNKRVSNYIEIATADDFYKIINNETGNFKIVNNIDMTDWCNQQSGNFILDINFQGVLIGEKEDGSGTPTLSGLTIDARNTGNAGFFNQTTNATIRNIKFEWNNANNNGAIVIYNTVDMVGMISSSDNGSLFSNLSVTTKTGESNMIATTNTERSSISGFGGIIGNASNSNVLNCSYVGNLDVKLNINSKDDVTVGGLVGSATRDINSDNQNEENTTNMTISSSFVGNIERKTTFTFTIPQGDARGNVYIGGLVGEARLTSISSVRLGSLDNENIDNQNVDINVEMSGTCNTIVSGGIARSEDSIMSSATILANITVSGEQGTTDGTTTVNTFVAGAVGEMQQTGATDNAQIREVGVTANIDLSSLSVNYLNTSLGVAYISGNSARIESSLFTGHVNSTTITNDETGDTTDSLNTITSVHYGGIVAQSESAVLTISESMAYVQEVNIGSGGTSILFAGGLVGEASSLSINDALTAGRIYPITNSYNDNSVLMLGGLVGEADGLTITRAISLESIFLNEIANDMLPHAQTGALYASAGREDAEGNVTGVNIVDVYYSSDLALVTQSEDVGTNLSVNLLINQQSIYMPNFNTDNTTIWGTVPAGNGDLGSVPYIASIEELLISHSILNITSTGYSYTQGTVFEPYVVDSVNEYIMQENYAYYLLSSNLTTLPKFTAHENNLDAIKGFIIGGEKSYSVNTTNNLSSVNNNQYSGVFASTDNKSAVSNIHLNLASMEDNTEVNVPNNVVGLVVGLNRGVMYNISVQGTGLTLSSTGNSIDIGLIAGRNEGLVYNAYSTAEILNVTVSGNSNLSGIVSQNAGKIVNSYFTGYINNVLTDSTVVPSAGIIGTVSENSYVYNSYMAGVIEGLSANGNSFYATSSDMSYLPLNGQNNYVDNLANVENLNTLTTGITSTNTLSIMNGTLLSGNWNVIFKRVDNVAAGYYIDPTSPSYGYNYGYPVYNDYKQTTSTDNAEDLQYSPVAYQLYTGTGSSSRVISTKEQLTIAPDIDNFPSVDSVTVNSVYSDNAYKIPHLGVLTSIQGLTYINTGSLTDGDASEFISTKLNYMIIYDLDGAGDNYNVDWNAVGRSTTVSTEQSTDLYYKVDGTNTFNGLVISNKNYAYSPLEKDNLEDLCTITNLSNNGLFANINNAYIGYIKLGNFLELNNSGALGTNVASIFNTGDNTSATTVTVQNVYFNKTTRDTLMTISGIGKTSETQNYIGGLFGEISSGNILIENIQTTTEIDGLDTVSVALEDSYYAGLIAGSMTNGSVTIPTILDEAQSLSVQFGDIRYAGGLIGYNAGGTIVGNDAKINLYAFTAEESVDILGGIIGLVESSSTTTVIERVEVIPSTSNTNISYISSFGGLVGEINGNIDLSDCIIYSDTLSRIETVDVESYFGLITAKLSGGTSTITGFSHQGQSNTISIRASENSDEDMSGFGVLIGKSEGSGEINISLGEAVSTTLEVQNGMNIGGILGWYNGGTINIITDENNSVNLNVTISGVTNVGGAIGLVTSDINNITDISQSGVANSNWNFLDSGTIYATLVTPTSTTTLQNWGGLFGKVSTDNLYLYTTDANQSNSDDRIIHEIVNYNTIEINSVEVYTDLNSVKLVNVGGVVGLFEGVTAIRLINEGLITHDATNYREYGYNNYDEASEIFLYSNGGEQKVAFKSINVGGVIGSASDNVQNLFALQNNANVSGYQNVGGLIGYMSAGTLQSDIPDTIIDNSEPISLTYNGADNIYVGVETTENPKYRFERNEITDENNEVVEIQYILTSDNSTSDDSVIYTLREDAISVSRDAVIIGVINVGGAVGLVTGGTIDSIWTQADIYGNTNIGGLVGYNTNTSDFSIIRNNIVGALSDPNQIGTDIETETIEIKGIYFASYEHNEATRRGEWKYAIPTSVGGFIGSSTAGEITYNNLIDGYVTSSEEGAVHENNGNASTISTIENYMADLSFTSSSDNGTYISSANPYSDLTNNQTEFNSITSGFGGFIGSVNMNSLYSYVDDNTSQAENLATTNNINVNINASLGVNVGTFYGYYYNVTTGDDSLPMLLMPQLLKDVSVSGGYNIGGMVGYFDGPGGQNSLTDLSNTNIDVNNVLGNSSVTINVQDTGIGMYVGGLIGKLTMDARGLQIVTMDTGGANITIYTNSSYYIGGLIGRLEGNLTEGQEQTNEDGEVSYTNPNIVSGLKVSGDDATNFGGLVGMLKVAKGGTISEGYARQNVTVRGTHNYPFTVNTIENSNYADGTSKLYADTSNSDYNNLIAQAYYVNLDTFNISASKTVPYSNPLNKTAIKNGEEYTVENQPNASKQNLADWMRNGNISGWVKDYTTFRTLQRNIPIEDNPGHEWDSIAVVYDAANITKVGTIGNLFLNANDLLLQPGRSADSYTDDYICYTIYEEMEGSPTLYSAIGFATPFYDDQGAYATPSDDEAKWWEYVGAFLGITEYPDQTLYIEVNDSENNIKGLTYFNWSTPYKTVGGTDISLIGANEDTAVDVVYNVGYYDESGSVYFMFDMVYYNKTLPNYTDNETGVTYSIGDNVFLPPDGSIFNVSGTNASVGETIVVGTTKGHSALYWAAAGTSTILILLSFVNPVGGIFNSANRILKVIAKVATKVISFAKKYRAALVALFAFSTIQVMTTNSNKTAKKIHNEKLDQSFGFMSQTYMRQILYNNGTLTSEDQSSIWYKGSTYIYYSSTRPADYYDKYYLYYDPLLKTSPYGTIDGPIILNSAGINTDGPDGRVVLFADSSNTEDAMTITSISINGNRVDDSYLDPDLKFIYHYYVYRNGVYYKILDDSTVEYTPTQSYLDTSGWTVGDYTTSNGYTYVRGNYVYNERERTWSYNNYTNDVDNNLVENDDGTFSSNGEPWGGGATANLPANVTQPKTFNYVADMSEYSESNNILTYTSGSWGNETTIEYHLGYSYMKNAYYTANGVQNEDLQKYATFTWVEDLSQLSGTLGIDYIPGTLRETTIVDGEEVITETTGYYQILSVQDDRPTSGEIFTYGEDDIISTSRTIYVNIYPYSFTNPYYENSTISNVQDSNYYTSDSASSISISHNVTYYYYDGGYIVGNEDFNKNNVYVLIENNNSIYDLLSTTIYDSNGNVTPVTYSGLIAGWNSNNYKNYYMSDPTDNADGLGTDNMNKVSYNYYVDEDEKELYILSSSLRIQNGILVTTRILTNEEQTMANYNYHKYLSNADIGLYTRYKYGEELVSNAIYNNIVDNGETLAFPTSNTGKTHYFTESVCITIGGGEVNLTFAKGGENDGRIEIDTGGVNVL